VRRNEGTKRDCATVDEAREDLVKRGEELGVKAEDFLNVIRPLLFVDVYINCITLPPSKEFDVVLRDAVAIGCDSSAFA